MAGGDVERLVDAAKSVMQVVNSNRVAKVLSLFGECVRRSDRGEVPSTIAATICRRVNAHSLFMTTTC